jgi:hypothetical protein
MIERATERCMASNSSYRERRERGTTLVSVRVVVVIGALVVTVAPAAAGNSVFAWAYDTTTLRTRKTELQFWISEENGSAHDTEFWAMPAFGVTPRLELAVPAVLSHAVADGEAARFTYDRHGVEARYRFTDDAIAPLARVAVFREIDAQGISIEADAVVSYARGRFRAVIDLGYVARFVDGPNEVELYPRAGASVHVTGPLRLGVESYAELELEHGYEPEELESVVVGPNLAITRGRFWLSATFGIGLKEITTAPRVQLGLLL